MSTGHRLGAVLVLFAAVAGCGGADDTAAPAPVLGFGQAELETSAAAITDLTTKLADSIDGFDGEAAAPLAAPVVRIVDPVYPSLGFSSITAYYSYLRAILDTGETVEKIVVNTDGSFTRVAWPTFFHVDPAGFDGPVAAGRHLLIADGQITRLMHLFEEGDARTNAAGISMVIPFASIGIPLEQSVADITEQADTAADLSAQWSAAWTAHDLATIGSLYADDAIRYDGYAGAPWDPTEIGAWATALFEAHPDLTVTVDEAFASGVGPAMLADMTSTVDGAPCTVRIGVVWALDFAGAIEREDVYYDPATLITCGWVGSATPDS